MIRLSLSNVRRFGVIRVFRIITQAALLSFRDENFRKKFRQVQGTGLLMAAIIAPIHRDNSHLVIKNFNISERFDIDAQVCDEN